MVVVSPFVSPLELTTKGREVEILGTPGASLECYSGLGFVQLFVKGVQVSTLKSKTCHASRNLKIQANHFKLNCLYLWGLHFRVNFGLGMSVDHVEKDPKKIQTQKSKIRGDKKRKVMKNLHIAKKLCTRTESSPLGLNMLTLPSF